MLFDPVLFVVFVICLLVASIAFYLLFEWYETRQAKKKDPMLEWVVNEVWNTGKTVHVEVDDKENKKVTYID